ncbi:MAG: NADH:flavin oxidoreductase/NADH oxidase [Planctomycetaceae bacterium]|nr:NADH:flavin oxidoreductase/NADH oxidase [Planctomycetaceae bacterium]
MARYFKYKTSAELVADATELGCNLDAAENLDSLFTPVSVGNVQVGNRLCIQPMEGCDGTLAGLPDELTFRRYQRFGAGGAKLIWGEATAVSDAGRMNPRQLWIHEGSASALEQMLAGCRLSHRDACGNDGDLLLGLQLTHSGRYSFRKPLVAMHDPILDPLTLDKSNGQRLDSSYPLLSDDDLRRIEDQFVAAAKLAKKVGCDFVDLKQCHRYLLSELLASKTRPGDYGGCFENRTRFIRNIVTRIRAEVPGLMLVSRFNAYDGIPYRGEGTGEDFIGVPCRHDLPLEAAFGVHPENHLQVDLAEPIALARLLRDSGIQILNVTLGNPYANPHVVRPAEFPPVDGYHCPEHPLIGVCRQLQIATAIQQAVPDIPVVGSGYSWLQEFALHVGAANVLQHRIGFVGLGRAALSHPDFARVAQETGKLNRKQICRTFSYCTGLMRNKQHPLGQFPTGCPPFDKDIYGPIWKEANGGQGIVDAQKQD